MKYAAALIALLFFALLSIPRPVSAGDGEALFKKKCKTCHKISAKKKVGPGMAGLSKRPGISREWLKKWLANPQKVWEENEGYTVAMKKALKKTKKKRTAMKLKGKFKVNPEEIDPIVDYIWGL
ncbi:MAG: c-type cytochrome [Nitrospinota bacterium]